MNSWKQIGCVLGLAATSVLIHPAFAAEHVSAQKNTAFSAKRMTIKVGDSVKFINEDSFSHNVFSMSDVKSFDLGSTPAGAAKSVVFDKAGNVEVECAVHPAMRMVIEVTK